MRDAWIALGANLGDAKATLLAAAQALDALPETRLIAMSSLYRTKPVDSSGPDYINAVAHIQTALSAEALLAALQKLEQAAGRERPYVNAPRTLDLDILLYDAMTIQTEALTVPHPRMWQREFVLVPLAEIAPHLVSESQLNSVAGQGVERIF